MTQKAKAIPKATEGVCFIFCGYHEPGVIICDNEALESWLEVACKDKPLAYTMEEWMISDGVAVIKGLVLDKAAVQGMLQKVDGVKKDDDSPVEANEATLQVLRAIVDDEGDWFSPEARSEFLYVLGRILTSKFLNSPGDGYDSVANDLIYSYWKMEHGSRMMAKETPDNMSAFSMEYAWDLLRKINLGQIVLPFEFVQYIRTTADVI